MAQEKRPADRPVARLKAAPPSLWYGLALLLILGLAQLYYLEPEGRQVPYSEFKAQLKSGNVSEITVGEQTIRGTLKQAVPSPGPGATTGAATTQFTTNRVDDPKLTEELESQQVKYSGETINRWLPELLGWLLPLVFFVAIWGFFFRRMSGAEGGVMSFARSRAKIYSEDDVKIGFGDVAGTIGLVLGRRPRRARFPTKARIPTKMSSFSVSDGRLFGRTFQSSHRVGCAQQTAHTEP